MAKAIIEIKDEFIFSFSKESRGSRDSREIPEFVRSFFIKNISQMDFLNFKCIFYKIYYFMKKSFQYRNFLKNKLYFICINTFYNLFIL